MLTDGGQWLLLMVPALFGVVLVVLLIICAIQGDAMTQLIGLGEGVTAERMAELRRIFGFDLPGAHAVRPVARRGMGAPPGTLVETPPAVTAGARIHASVTTPATRRSSASASWLMWAVSVNPRGSTEMGMLWLQIGTGKRSV